MINSGWWKAKKNRLKLKAKRTGTLPAPTGTFGDYYRDFIMIDEF